jgi:hypothetical protein
MAEHRPHTTAAATIGTIEGDDPVRAETANEIVRRKKLRRSD